ncbi:MAG: hypothetical protein ACSHX8_09575 [Opitutaceae bacterium]
MEDKNNATKFKLSKKPEVESPDASDIPEASNQPRKLRVRPTTPIVPQPTNESEEITVHEILNEAYAPDREKARRVKRNELSKNITFVLGLAALAVVLTFGYAHFWNQWPIVQPISWYAPFIISLAVSLYMVIRGIYVFKSARTVSMLVTGITLAGALSYVNIVVLGVTAQSDHYAPDNCLWEAEDSLEMLLAYEINACRGWAQSPSVYTSISMNQYKEVFRALPRTEWKPYFKKHLTSEELQKTNSINIDERMRVVASRMLEARANTWNEFNTQYEELPIELRMKRWLILPYTAAFKLL